MGRGIAAAAGLGLVLTLASACSSPPPPPPLVVNVFVQGDPGVPLAGASLLFGGDVVGITAGPRGLAELRLTGEEGQAFDLTVRCPEGYRSPPDTVTVVLRRLAEPSKVPAYQATCAPTTRSVVVAIAADNGAGLPVVYLGREIARTDAAGAANVLLQVAPGEPIALTLATTDKNAQNLRPQNPVATFNVKDEDDVFAFSQRFTDETKRVVYHARKATGPTRLGSLPH
jgi:hypothetical protein